MGAFRSYFCVVIGSATQLLCCACISGSTLTALEPGGVQEAQQETTLSPEQAKADLEFLYRTMQASAYDFFYNADKDELDRQFERAYANIDSSLTILQLNRISQKFVARANLSHAVVDFPWESYHGFTGNSGKLFPIEIAFVQGEPFIAMSYAHGGEIQPGDQLLAIDGEPVSETIREIRAHISAENEYAENALLELKSFVESYWYAIGAFDSAELTVKKPDGSVTTATIAGVSYEEREELKKAVSRPPVTDNSREFYFIDEIAYLRPGLFYNVQGAHADSEKARDRGEFETFISSAFSQIAENGATKIILDLRGNNGGDNSFSDLMIAYFADEPFRIASSFKVRTSERTKEIWRDVDLVSLGLPHLVNMKRQIMELENSAVFEADLGAVKPRADQLSYDGDVYALINRFSFSNAAVVAAIIQDYGFGVIIGEETSYTPSSCGAMHSFSLPHSKISASYPKACSVRPNGDPTLRGVIPDYELVDDIFTEQDEVLDGAVALVSRQ